MSIGEDPFFNGTEIFALMLGSDGLLEPGLLNKLYDAVDFGTWVSKNQPAAIPAYNDMANLTDETGLIVQTGDPEGEMLKNAICHYVVSVLNIWKNTKIGGSQTMTSGTTASGTISMTLMSTPVTKPTRKTW
jgi:hypothetical protein